MPENINGRCVLFEAGAPSKTLEKGRGCSHILDLQPMDLREYRPDEFLHYLVPFAILGEPDLANINRTFARIEIWTIGRSA